MGRPDQGARVLCARRGGGPERARPAGQPGARRRVADPVAGHGRGLPLAGRQHHPDARRRRDELGAGDGDGQLGSGGYRRHRFLHHAGHVGCHRLDPVAARDAAVRQRRDASTY
ncbi:hypothetical protein G6F31_019033 [Rhizopus arrhizus]|nr:hypothetical protein G6F31_019033 [Rhizopus arrhizus]